MTTFHTKAAMAALCTLALTATAHAHATLQQREAKAGASYRGVLRVPHGCDGTATLKVRLTIPEGLYSVKPMPKAGWELSTTKGAYAKTYQDHGTPVSQGVKEIVWSGKLPDDNYDEFIFVGTVAPDLADGTKLYFPAVQECERGTANWTDIPKGSERVNAAAPMVRVAATAMAQTDAKSEFTVGAIKVVTPWTRATPKGAPVGGGYLTITNTGTETDRLVGGTFPGAGKVEVHEMSMDNGMMRMRQLPKGLEIAPGATVELKPGGYHLMFTGLTAPIAEGKPVSGTLVFEKAGTLNLQWAVSPIGASAAPAGGGMSGGHEGHQHH
ncbi:MAG TPA: DUF1775 domain-containing protein [Beijerinckiaceae bacterium]|nr:DUF1775 domain-containing protein [Beijerinckiaceae bacterium]